MKVRAVTVGCPLSPLELSAPFSHVAETIRRVRVALEATGLEVQTTRVATLPMSAYMGGETDPAEISRVALDMAGAAEDACIQEGLGYVALGAVDTLYSPELVWRTLLDTVPEIIRGTERVFCSAGVADRFAGINVAATRACGDLVARVAAQTADGFGNLRFAALANCPPDIPFFPAACHSGGPEETVGLALEAADVAVVAFEGAGSLEDARRRLVEGLTSEVRRTACVVEQALVGHAGARFTGIDLSLAPFPADDRSIANAFERLGLPAFGAHGTLFLASLLTECLQQVAEQTGMVHEGKRFGFSGLMLPVLEDSVLARRAADGLYGVDSLLLYSAVCGLGLDTVPLPGDTPPGELGAIILDMATLAVRLDKPLTARLFPVPGKRAGDPVQWDFAFFAPSRVLPVRGLAPQGALATAGVYNPQAKERANADEHK